VLAAEVIVDGGDVRMRALTDLAHRDFREAALGEEACGRFDETLARLEVGLGRSDGDRPRHPCGHRHSVRLNSAVAAVIAIAEKTNRNSTSPAMAPKPVFLSSRLLKA